MSRLDRVLFLLLFFVTILLSNPALAENRGGASSLSTMLGYHFIDGGMDLDDNVVYGLSAGYNFTQNWSIEGGFSFTPTETESGSTDVNIWALSLGALYHFFPEEYINPYLSAGGGGLIYDIDNTSHDDEDYMVFWGGGVKYAITENTALRLDLRHILDYRCKGNFKTQDNAGSDWRHQLQVTAGLTFQFGGDSKYRRGRRERRGRRR